MAENKKSFLLYADIIHTIRKMPDDKSGQLFKTILAYVNDENPEVNDLVIDLVFEPIKQQLKRDLKRWEDFKAKQAINGAKGGRPKKVVNINGGYTNPENPSLLKIPKQSLNANANANVNVNVNVKLSREKVFELLRSKTNRNTISDRQLHDEVALFIEKYQGQDIGNLGALISTWAGNIKPELKNRFTY